MLLWSWCNRCTRNLMMMMMLLRLLSSFDGCADLWCVCLCSCELCGAVQSRFGGQHIRDNWHWWFRTRSAVHCLLWTQRNDRIHHRLYVNWASQQINLPTLVIAQTTVYYNIGVIVMVMVNINLKIRSSTSNQCSSSCSSRDRPRSYFRVLYHLAILRSLERPRIRERPCKNVRYSGGFRHVRPNRGSTKRGHHKSSGNFYCMPEIMGDTRVNEWNE